METQRDENHSLFRKEVLENKVISHLGPVLMTLSPQLTFVSVACGLLVLILIGYGLFVSYPDRVMVPGYLDVHPGIVNLYARQSGMIMQQAIKIGQKVKKGQMLYVIQPGNTQTQKIERRVLTVFSQLQQDMAKDVLKKRRVMQKYRALVNHHYLSKKEFAQFKKEWVDAKREWAELTLRRMNLLLAHEDDMIAPIDCIVSNMMTEQGQFVREGQLLAKLLPSAAIWYATLLVPVKDIRFVKINQKIQFQYTAYPFLQYGTEQGKIIAVSEVVSVGHERDRPIKMQEPFYEVTARFMGAPNHLFKRYQGMTFQAALVGEAIPLWRRLVHI